MSTSYWPELYHKVSSNHKTGLELEKFTLQSLGEKDKGEEIGIGMAVDLTEANLKESTTARLKKF